MKCQGSTVVSITAGASVAFTYHSGAWYVSSEPVYGSTATIGNSQSKNAYIDGNGVYLRNGSTVLASFTPSLIELAKNSNASELSLLGGAIDIQAQIVNGSINMNNLTAPAGIRISTKSSGESGSANVPYIQVEQENLVLSGYDNGSSPVMINGAYYSKKQSTTVSCSYGISITFTRIGQVVEMSCNCKNTSTMPTKNQNITICTIPYGYRPTGYSYVNKVPQASLGTLEVGVNSSSITLGYFINSNNQPSEIISGNWFRFHELWLTYDS